MVDIQNRFNIGSKCVIANEADMRGDITVGTGTVLHPRCTVLAMSGPIILGNNCIVEENVVIVNRTKQTMRIGDENHFQVGCRIESITVGNHNIFAPRCRTSHLVSVGSNCNIGAGCIVLPSPFPPTSTPSSVPPLSAPPISTAGDEPPPPPVPAKPGSETIPEEPDHPSSSDVTMATASPAPPPSVPPTPTGETLPDYTQVFGDGRRRIWSGEGKGQARAFHTKHLDYLRETLPKYSKLKMFT